MAIDQRFKSSKIIYNLYSLININYIVRVGIKKSQMKEHATYKKPWSITKDDDWQHLQQTALNADISIKNIIE